MEKQLYDTLYKLEGKYWWFVGQRFLIHQLLNKYYPRCKKRLLLLDVGCGTGLTMQELNKFGKAYGIDIADEALRFCRKRGLANIKKSNVMGIKFNDGLFDIVTSLGVFYHKNVTDEAKAFSEIYRVLKPGGRLLFFDCAMMCLYGKHDLAFHGIRRYSKKELTYKLKRAGFTIEKITYVNTLLFPALYLSRKLGKMTRSKPKSEVQESISPLLNLILKALYKMEIRGAIYSNYPFGINIFAVARKK